jgi:hypothetical protein
MTNEELERTIDLEDFNRDKMKDDIHHLYEENKELKVKSEVLEENNKLLIQQKTQMYEDLDIAYERIDKAIEYIKAHSEMTDLQICGIENVLAFRGSAKKLLEILGDKE